MSIFRNILLWGSENQFMKNRVPKFWFVKKAVKRFMPGENITDAIDTAIIFNKENIPVTFTNLGENIFDLSEAEKVTNHYLTALDEIAAKKLDVEISLKLTQIGFDLSLEKTFDNFCTIATKAAALNNYVWIDMESSNYTEKTIDFYIKAKKEFSNIGLCLQAYLYRTESDIKKLLPTSPSIRLVKGAYNEPKEAAFENKSDVDKNYFELAKILLNGVINNKTRVAFATHDELLISKIESVGKEWQIPKQQFEFQMLYGIKFAVQKKLARAGLSIRVLISYGDAWFPWYMRRLAERPANVLFVLKNIF